MQSVQVCKFNPWSGSHMPQGQKIKTWNRSDILTSSIQALKIVHIKNKKKQKPQSRMLFSWLELKLNQAVNFCKIDSGLSFMLNIRCFTGEMAIELAIVVSQAMKVKKGIPQQSFSFFFWFLKIFISKIIWEHSNIRGVFYFMLHTEYFFFCLFPIY